MPDGLDQSLTDAELADLFRFLAELGKPGPFGVSHQAFARRWQILSAVPADLSGLDDAALGKLLHEEPTLSWKPLYAKVSGLVPLLETTSSGVAPIVRCQLEVVTSGKVGLRLNDANGLTMWLDGKPVPAQTNLTLDLSRGLHELALRAIRRLGSNAI